MKSRKPKIISVRIEIEPDRDPDLSYLGEFTNEPAGWYIDRATGRLMIDGDCWGEINCRTYIDNGHQLGYVSRFQHPGTCKELPEKAIQITINDPAVAPLFQRFKIPHADNGYIGNLRRRLEALYCCQDGQRLEDYCDGQWNMTGLIVKAVVQSGESNILQTLRSGGLWGIESDLGRDHYVSVLRSELAVLRDELQGFGFSRRQIAYAFQHLDLSMLPDK